MGGIGLGGVEFEGAGPCDGRLASSTACCIHNFTPYYIHNCYTSGLPLFPPLPGDTDEKTVEEIGRTVVVMGLNTNTNTNNNAQDTMEEFTKAAGEVKYFRQGVLELKCCKWPVL